MAKWLTRYAKDGDKVKDKKSTKPPIYITHDPNDRRIQAYADSNYLHKNLAPYFNTNIDNFIKGQTVPWNKFATSITPGVHTDTEEQVDAKNSNFAFKVRDRESLLLHNLEGNLQSHNIYSYVSDPNFNELNSFLNMGRVVDHYNHPVYSNTSPKGFINAPSFAYHHMNEFPEAKQEVIYQPQPSIPQPKPEPKPKPRVKQQLQSVSLSQPSFPRTTGEPQSEQININDWNPNEEQWLTPYGNSQGLIRPAGFYKKGMLPGEGYVPSRKNGGAVTKQWLKKYTDGGKWDDPNRPADITITPARGISAGTTTANVPGQKMSQKQVDALLKYTQKRADDAQVQADIQRQQADIMSQHMGPAPVYTPYGQEEHAQRLHEMNRDAGRDDQGNPVGFTKWALENNKGQRADDFIQKVFDAGTAAEGAEGLYNLGKTAAEGYIKANAATAAKTASYLPEGTQVAKSSFLPNWLKKYGAKSEKNLISSEIPAITKTTPTSEIDWAKWNSEIPNNSELLNEYNTIEQSSKKAGTWMKNPDGTKFQGTPEQFVQQNSQNFKKAFPQGHHEVWRGVGNHYPELKPYEAIFTGNKDLASHYTGNKSKILLENDPVTQAGMYNLAHPKSTNSLTMDALGKEWGNVSLKDPSQVKELLEKRIPFYEQQIKKQKDFLESGIQNKDGSWSFPNTDIKYSNDLYKEGTKGYDELLHSSKESLKNIDNLVDNPRILQEMRSNLENKRNLEIDEYARIHKLTDENRKKLGTNIITDDIAKYIEDADLDFVRLNNIHDGAFGDVSIVNHKKGNYLKSLVGNNGMFDMTNPNIYKSLLPAGVTLGALKSAMSQQDIKQYGGTINKTGGWLSKY